MVPVKFGTEGIQKYRDQYPTINILGNFIYLMLNREMAGFNQIKRKMLISRNRLKPCLLRCGGVWQEIANYQSFVETSVKNISSTIRPISLITFCTPCVYRVK